MTNYLSRAEIEEVSEGLIQAYAQKYPKRASQYIDIEHFITMFLSLKIEYVAFGESDGGKMGFLADGETPLLVRKDGRIAPVIYPKDTVVVDRFLLADKETGRRRFTLAHEAAHYILTRMHNQPRAGCFHNEFDSDRTYTKDELAQMFAATEWQADAMAASLLMPRRLVSNVLTKYNRSYPIKIYGDNVVASKDKQSLRNMANHMMVSYTALFIRLRDMNLLEGHDVSEYISKELNLGGLN